MAAFKHKTVKDSLAEHFTANAGKILSAAGLPLQAAAAGGKKKKAASLGETEGSAEETLTVRDVEIASMTAMQEVRIKLLVITWELCHIVGYSSYVWRRHVSNIPSLLQWPNRLCTCPIHRARSCWARSLWQGLERIRWQLTLSVWGSRLSTPLLLP